MSELVSVVLVYKDFPKRYGTHEKLFYNAAYVIQSSTFNIYKTLETKVIKQEHMGNLCFSELLYYEDRVLQNTGIQPPHYMTKPRKPQIQSLLL
jgi:hypothetical protein